MGKDSTHNIIHRLKYDVHNTLDRETKVYSIYYFTINEFSKETYTYLGIRKEASILVTMGH